MRLYFTATRTRVTFKSRERLPYGSCFIGQANKKYNFAMKFEAIVGKGRKSIRKQVEDGFSICQEVAISNLKVCKRIYSGEPEADR